MSEVDSYCLEKCLERARDEWRRMAESVRSLGSPEEERGRAGNLEKGGRGDGTSESPQGKGHVGIEDEVVVVPRS